MQGLGSDLVAARGSFSIPKDHKSNFGQLRIRTSASFSITDQHFAAGLLEGFLTADSIALHHSNMDWWLKNISTNASEVVDWLNKQDTWAQNLLSQTVELGSNNSYYVALNALFHQFEGLIVGYQSAARKANLPILKRTDLLVLNSLGDIMDLVPMLNRATAPAWDSLAPAEAAARLATSGHCSALIRVAGDLSDLFFGHTTWFHYTFMNRIYKHYEFALDASDPARGQLSFPSYPGLLSSLDDLYLTGGGLAVMETTNDVLDLSLYSHTSHDALLAWQRVRAALAVATDGKSWVEAMCRHNSGTYNNQYMVLDLPRFSPGHPLAPGLLWVMEQLPGRCVSGDRTSDLERGYWPSYNVPYFREVYDAMGYSQLAARLRSRGPKFADVAAGLDYQLAPRATIFRRDQGAAASLAGMARLLRFNDWRHDNYSKANPYWSICARGDLDPSRPRASGCTDTKVTSASLARRRAVLAVNGPTAEQQPLFDWASVPPALSGVPHRGLAKVYDFEFEMQRP